MARSYGSQPVHMTTRACTAIVLPMLLLLHVAHGYQHHNLTIMGLHYRAEVPHMEQDITNNVGVAFFDGKLHASIRRVRYQPGPASITGDASKGPFKTWINTNYFCQLAGDSFNPENCDVWDPIDHNQTCGWNDAEDTTGIEDARLFVWPGKGLYSLFQAKPLGKGLCAGLQMAPYLALVQRDPHAAPPAVANRTDPWMLKQPTMLHIRMHDMRNPCRKLRRSLANASARKLEVGQRNLHGTEAADPANPASQPTAATPADPSTANPQPTPATTTPPPEPQSQAAAANADSPKPSQTTTTDKIAPSFGQPSASGEGITLCTPDLLSVLTSKKQKNWAPFVHNASLYFSISFEPHVVVGCKSSGRCRFRHVTSNTRMFEETKVYGGNGPRGNSPTVLVPTAVSQEKEPFYLGILHFKDPQIGYTNLFFKMAAHPPFQILQLSNPIPLLAQGVDPGYPTPIAFPIGLEVLSESSQVLVSYGSGDKASHLTALNWGEVTDLFKQPRPPVSKSSRKLL